MDLLISDLHLHEGQPFVPQLVDKFFNEIAPKAKNLYVLGDLFEYWIGDDATSNFNESIIQKFAQFSSANKGLFFMHGNRDFLLGKKFLEQTGGQLIEDCRCVNLEGESTLLMHGDALCVQDVEYQTFKSIVRKPQWQTNFLSKTFQQRIDIAKQMRQKSEQNYQLQKGSQTENTIIDVDQDEVCKVIQQARVKRLIHGHTHRQNIHRFTLNNQSVERVVLGDWGKTGCYCICESDNIGLVNFD